MHVTNKEQEIVSKVSRPGVSTGLELPAYICNPPCEFTLSKHITIKNKIQRYRADDLTDIYILKNVTCKLRHRHIVSVNTFCDRDGLIYAAGVDFPSFYLIALLEQFLIRGHITVNDYRIV